MKIILANKKDAIYLYVPYSFLHKTKTKQKKNKKNIAFSLCIPYKLWNVWPKVLAPSWTLVKENKDDVCW